MNFYIFFIFLLLPGFIYVSAESEADSLDEQGKESYNSGDFEKALDYFEKAHTLEQNNVKFLNNMASAYLKLNNTDQAYIYLKKGHEIDPTHKDILNNMGALLYLTEEWYRAAVYYEQLMKLYPEHESAKNNFQSAQEHLRYFSLNGTLEITIRNSQGGLVSNSFVPYLYALKSELAIDDINNEWEFDKTIEQNGKKFSVIKETMEYRPEETNAFSSWGIGTRDSEISIFKSVYSAIVVKEGDVVTFDWTIFQPID